MFEVIWQEFTRKAKIRTRIRTFRSEKAMDRFIDKLHKKENFWQILNYVP